MASIMSKCFGFFSKKGELPSALSTRASDNSAGTWRERQTSASSQPGYHIRDRELRNIHRAASVGDVAEVEKILRCQKMSLNKRDKRKRTSLHLACASGHHEVVTLLVESKCHLDLYDSENRTALMKAVQCEKEECVDILLEHGADPDLMDSHGNTALHHAVCGHRVSIAAKLLLHHANIEARNKEGLTPLFLAIKENKQPMVEFLVRKGANIRAFDKMKSNCQLISKYTEEQRLTDSSPNRNPESLEKYPHLKPTVEMKVSVPNKAVGEKYVQTSRSDWSSTSLTTSNNTCSKSENWKVDDKYPLVSQSVTQNQPASTELGQMTSRGKENINIGTVFLLGNYALHDLCESQLPENKESKEGLSAELDFRMAAEKEREWPDGNENKQPRVDEEKEKPISNQMEILENLYDGAAAADDDDDDDDGLIQQRKNGRTDNQQLHTEENEEYNRSSAALSMNEVKKNENKKWTSKESVIAPVLEKADSLTGGAQQVNGDSRLGKIDQDERRPPEKTCKEKNKVKNQINSVDVLDDFTRSSETDSGLCELPDSNSMKLLIEQLKNDCKDSMSLLKIQDAFVSYERLVEYKNNHCELLTEKVKRSQSKVSGLQRELLKKTEMILQLKCETMEWERENFHLSFTLNQEKEKRKDADLLYNKQREWLQRTRSEDAAVRQQLKVTLRTRDEELRALRDSLNQVSDSHKKDLLHINHMLQDENAKLRLEIDTIKNQYQKKKKKYSRVIEIVKEKNDDLQKIMKQNEETLRKRIFQYTGQLNVLTAENTTLNSKLENEKQNKDRLEKTEVESYRSRPAAAVQDHDQSQTSEKDLELALQRARDEWFHLQDKMNFDLSNMKDNNEFLSQQFSKAERKSNSLEVKLHHTRDALREKTLVSKYEQGDLSQPQRQRKEAEHVYQNEQGKVNKCTGKQESVEESLSHLQRQNMLLRQQLDDADNKADHKEKIVINIQGQRQDIVTNLQRHGEKVNLILEERNKELTNECHHLKEKRHHRESKKAEREIIVRPGQQGLADTREKESTSGTSREATSWYPMILEKETQDLKRRLCQSHSQIDDLTAQLEAASSKCLHLEAKNRVLQQKMKTVQKECEKLEKTKMQLEEVVANLKSHMERNMVERDQVEQYTWETEERARQDVVKKFKEVRLFLQEQAAFQENLTKSRENINASIISEMELRIKELESELVQMKNSPDYSHEIELEKYKQLYLVELEVRKSLSDQLRQADDRLAEVNTQLIREKERYRSLVSTLTVTTRPVLEPPGIGIPNRHLGLDRNHFARQNLVIPTSAPQSSHESIDDFLAKVQKKFNETLTRELEQEAVEFKYRVFSLKPNDPNQDPVLKAAQEYTEILKRKYMI